MKAEVEARYDTEIAAATTKGPKQVWMPAFVGDEHFAISGDQLGAEQVVTCEAMATHQLADAAAQREAGRCAAALRSLP
jgi:hypothetical protein